MLMISLEVGVFGCCCTKMFAVEELVFSVSCWDNYMCNFL